MIEDIIKALKAHANEHFINHKTVDKADKIYINILNEIIHLLKTKQELIDLYNEILIQGTNKNRQQYIDKLNKISGHFKIDVTMNELKEVKESVE